MATQLPKRRRDGLTRKEVLFNLDVDLNAEITRVAKKLGISRSSLLEHALKRVEFDHHNGLPEWADEVSDPSFAQLELSA